MKTYELRISETCRNNPKEDSTFFNEISESFNSLDDLKNTLLIGMVECQRVKIKFILTLKRINVLLADFYIPFGIKIYHIIALYGSKLIGLLFLNKTQK